MSYTKLFSHIITSSVWSEDDQTRILWITLLALTDKHGEVMASIPGLAKVSNLTIESVKRGIENLSSPDEYSRTPDEEGRRIVQIPGGWSVVNYEKHRRMASIDEQREKTAARVQRFRERKAREEERTNVTHSVTHVNGLVTHSNGYVTHQTDNAEAEAEYRVQSTPSAEIESPERKNQKARSARVVCAEFEEFWSELPKENRIAKGRTRDAWHKAIKSGFTADQILGGIDSYKAYEKKRRRQNDYRPLHPSTWLNQGRFEDGEIIEQPKASDDNWINTSIYG